MMEYPVDEFPHLSKLEASLPVEYPEKVIGSISGSVPLWLKGSWYRNGPGIIYFKKQTVNHWFDGMALARKFTIKDGEVSYLSQLVDGESKKRNIKAGKLVISEFGTPATHEGFEKIIKMVTMPDLTDNCLVSFLTVGRHLFAISESNTAIQLDPATLNTVKTFDLSKFFPIHVMGSHPLHDPDQKALYTFSSSILDHGHTKYNLLKLPGVKADLHEALTAKEVLERGESVNSINAASRFNPSYHHSFSMTTNYAIFIEIPLRLDIASLATAHLVGKSCAECMHDQPGLNTSIFLLPKKKDTKHHLTYSCDPVYIWHHVNAYEEDDHIILDVVCYDKPIFMNKFFVADLKLTPAEYAKKYEDKTPRVVRIVLPLTKSSTAQIGDNLVTLAGSTCKAILRKNDVVECSMETIIDGVDFPVINEKRRGLRCNYVYSPGGKFLPPGDRLSKVSLNDGRVVGTWQEKGCYCSQPVFIPEPDAVEEDEGILMSSVTNANGKPFLLMLDARDFTEAARVHFDANIPPDIHGTFVDE